MIIRLDARRFTDAETMHASLAEAFGFPAGYGHNLDALVDCLDSLDDPAARMSRITVRPGSVLVLALDHARHRAAAPQVRALQDAIAFVHWRRIEDGRPPIIALAYDRS